MLQLRLLLLRLLLLLLVLRLMMMMVMLRMLRHVDEMRNIMRRMHIRHHLKLIRRGIKVVRRGMGHIVCHLRCAHGKCCVEVLCRQ
jgi:hypothetical protein